MKNKVVSIKVEAKKPRNLVVKNAIGMSGAGSHKKSNKQKRANEKAKFLRDVKAGGDKEGKLGYSLVA
jgi:hypothetical protein